MTWFQLTFDVTGLRLVKVVDQPAIPDRPDFPEVNIGTDQNQWPRLIANLFMNWAGTFGGVIYVQISHEGQCRAWMLPHRIV